jgi:hypothetical protein
LFPQANKIVILIDSGQRFDKGRLAARGKPVHNSRYEIARVGSDRYDETAVAKCDDFFLNGARLTSENGLQSAMNAISTLR